MFFCSSKIKARNPLNAFSLLTSSQCADRVEVTLRNIQTDISLTSDELGAGVFVDLCHVNDRASLLGVAQGAETFLDVASCWAESGNHGCFGITTETLFQQPAAKNIDYFQNGAESSFKSLVAYYSAANNYLLYLEYS